LRDSADADATLIGKTETSADAESTVLPLPPVGKAVEDAEPPTGAAVDALQVPEVGTRNATAAEVLLIGGATTATALAASDAQPVTASRPLEVGINVGPDELKDRLGRDFCVHEQGVVLHCGVRRGPNWPRVGSATDFRSHTWRTPRRKNIIGRTWRLTTSFS
jgi:hypothetical protein